MSLQELGQALASMYNNAPNGYAVTMIHLFGIKFSEEIEKSGYSKKDIAEAADLPVSYATEIYKGIRLAKYVSPNTK